MFDDGMRRNVEPFPRFLRVRRILQEDLVAAFCHVPHSFGVLRLAVVATRGARLALEILEPGFQLRPFMVVAIVARVTRTEGTVSSA